TQPRDQNGSKTDAPGWTIIDKPSENNEADNCHGHGPGIETSFSLQLGWGNWRFTVFSWEMSIRK
ncbi:hypothetical protein B0J11DRAFT_410751, partial [Dendryphion nanum]